MRELAKVLYGTIAHEALPNGIHIGQEACIEYTGMILEAFYGTNEEFKSHLKSSTNGNVLEDYLLLEAAAGVAKKARNRATDKEEEVDEEVNDIIKAAGKGKSVVSKINNAVIGVIKKDKKRDEQQKEKEEKVKEKIEPTEDLTDETVTESANVILEGLKLSAFKSKLPVEEAKKTIMTAYTILETLVTMDAIEANHVAIVETVINDREINKAVKNIKAPMLNNNLVEATVKTLAINDKFRMFNILASKRIPLTSDILESVTIDGNYEDKLKTCVSLLRNHGTAENIKHINAMTSNIVEAADTASKDNGSTFGIIPGVDKENSITRLLNVVEASTKTSIPNKTKLKYVRDGVNPFIKKMSEIDVVAFKNEVHTMPPKEKKEAIIAKVNEIIDIMKGANAEQKKLLKQYDALKEIFGTGELVKLHRSGVRLAKKILRMDPTISIKTNRALMGKMEKAITTGTTTAVKAKLSPNVSTIMK